LKGYNDYEGAFNILKNKSEDVESAAEADVLVCLLENIIDDYQQNVYSLSAPEANVLKRVAIIRTEKFSINLINPKIIAKEKPVLSLSESCVSFSGVYHNCLRYDKISIENGFKKEIVELSGHIAMLAQHAIDHLNGMTYHERAIKMALVRNEGQILNNDFCVCGSKKRFKECCNSDIKNDNK
jgi:peptide deformylase